MTIGDDIKAKAKSTFESAWTTRDGRVVPEPTSVKQSNDAIEFELATVAYADLDQSTSLVDKKKWQFAAEVYKTFLYAATRLLRAEGGAIVSYDGDRVMAVFIGDSQCSSAVRAALKINYAVKNLLQPALKKQYTTDFEIRHTVGIDTSQIRAAQAGTRGDNDLVWVGKAANHAAKLTALSADHPTWITKRVYDRLSDDTKFSAGKNMWQSKTWAQMDNASIYSSTYWWNVS